jgi:hypothetical protein
MAIVTTVTHKYNTDWQRYTLYEPEVTVEHVGRVLDLFSDYEDACTSDVYEYAHCAHVWFPNEQRIKKVILSITGIAYTPDRTVVGTVDASDELRMQIKMIQEAQERDLREAARKAAEEEERLMPRKGKKMRVAKGRTAKGYEGYLCHVIDSNYGPKWLMKDRYEDAKNREVPGMWIYAYNLVPIG